MAVFGLLDLRFLFPVITVVTPSAMPPAAPPPFQVPGVRAPSVLPPPTVSPAPQAPLAPRPFQVPGTSARQRPSFFVAPVPQAPLGVAPFVPRGVFAKGKGKTVVAPVPNAPTGVPPFLVPGAHKRSPIFITPAAQAPSGTAPYKIPGVIVFRAPRRLIVIARHVDVPNAPLPVVPPGVTPVPPPPPPPSPPFVRFEQGNVGPNRTFDRFPEYLEEKEKDADFWKIKEKAPLEPVKKTVPEKPEEEERTDEADYAIMPMGDEVLIRALADGFVEWVIDPKAGPVLVLTEKDGTRYIYARVEKMLGSARHVTHGEPIGVTGKNEDVPTIERPRLYRSPPPKQLGPITMVPTVKGILPVASPISQEETSKTIAVGAPAPIAPASSTIVQTKLNIITFNQLFWPAAAIGMAVLGAVYVVTKKKKEEEELEDEWDDEDDDEELEEYEDDNPDDDEDEDEDDDLDEEDEVDEDEDWEEDDEDDSEEENEEEYDGDDDDEDEEEEDEDETEEEEYEAQEVKEPTRKRNPKPVRRRKPQPKVHPKKKAPKTEKSLESAKDPVPQVKEVKEVEQPLKSKPAPKKRR